MFFRRKNTNGCLLRVQSVNLYDNLRALSPLGSRGLAPGQMVEGVELVGQTGRSQTDNQDDEMSTAQGKNLVLSLLPIGSLGRMLPGWCLVKTLDICTATLDGGVLQTEAEQLVNQFVVVHDLMP